MSIKLNTVALIVISALSASATAVTLESSITHGSTIAHTEVNKVAEINGATYELKYTQDRGVFDHTQDPNTGANTGGVPVEPNYVVSARIDTKLTETDLTQTVSGVNSTYTFTDSTAMRAGDLYSASGNRITDVVLATKAVNDGVTTVSTGFVEVNTSTQEPYLGGGTSKPGNDVDVAVNGFTFNTEGETINVADAFTAINQSLTIDDVVITGQDLNSADRNGLSVNVGYQDTLITDASITDTTGTTRTVSVFNTIE